MQMITSAAKLFASRKKIRALMSTKLSFQNISRQERPNEKPMTLLFTKSIIPNTSTSSKTLVSIGFQKNFANKKCDRSRSAREENFFINFSSNSNANYSTHNAQKGVERT
jgi:hypothetical protein